MRTKPMDTTHSPQRLACACGSPHVGRRRVLGGLAALGGMSLASGCATLAGGEDAGARIDVHHHIVPPAWLESLRRAKLDTPPVAKWTVQQSLDDMDRGGVTTSMTSPTLPAVGFLPAAEAARVARESNEWTRKLVDSSKGRFRMFALLPMPHVDETLREISYAVDVLKADGVAFMTSYQGRYLGDKAFAPVMDELHRRKLTAYTHPDNPACCSNIESGVPPVIIEYGTDTTRTIASLIFSGTAQRCPDINFIFSHGGGTIAALSDRFLVQIVSMPAYKQRGFTSERVLKELRSFYYDTAQAANPMAMAALTRLVPASQIVFGTDYPYRRAEEHVKGLAGIFNSDELRAIDAGNAQRIMPQLKQIQVARS
jgi:predicted TIM-barrel fold metal-dependent hydrolase